MCQGVWAEGQGREHFCWRSSSGEHTFISWEAAIQFLSHVGSGRSLRSLQKWRGKSQPYWWPHLNIPRDCHTCAPQQQQGHFKVGLGKRKNSTPFSPRISFRAPAPIQKWTWLSRLWETKLWFCNRRCFCSTVLGKHGQNGDWKLPCTPSTLLLPRSLHCFSGNF